MITRLMKRYRWLLLLAGLLPLIAAADSPIDPFPKTTLSRNRESSFMMIPAQRAKQLSPNGTYPNERDAYGIAYQAMPDGTTKELWRVDGWYSFSVLISNDGHHLVHVEPVIGVRAAILDASEPAPPDEDLAIEFYEDGRLLRRHVVSSLVRDTDAMEQIGMSGLCWLSRHASSRIGEDQGHGDPAAHISGDAEFRLTTCDEILYRFSLETGEIIESRPPTIPRQFRGMTPRQLRHLAIAIDPVNLPLPLQQCAETLNLNHWETKTLHDANPGAAATHYALLSITGTDDPRGYFELKFDIRDFAPASADAPEKGSVTGIHLLFRSPDGTCVDCVERMCEREELEHARIVAQYSRTQPSVKPLKPPSPDEPLPIYCYWFREYYTERK